jgi:hypothetical protein
MPLLRAIVGLLGASATIKNCGTSNDLAKYVSGSISPVPVVPGENVTISFTYNLGAPVTGGTAEYTYSMNYIPFAPDDVSLCDATSCPKQPGQYTETSTNVFPTDVAGRLDGTIVWKTETDDQILCVKTTFLL